MSERSKIENTTETTINQEETGMADDGYMKKIIITIILAIKY